jgi:hypothetical protein
VRIDNLFFIPSGKRLLRSLRNPRLGPAGPLRRKVSRGLLYEPHPIFDAAARAPLRRLAMVLFQDFHTLCDFCRHQSLAIGFQQRHHYFAFIRREWPFATACRIA